jgi:hypothetical protein
MTLIGSRSTAAGILALTLMLFSAPVFADNYKGPPTPCEKEISPGDAAGLLKGKAEINHYSMGASLPGEGCELGVHDGSNNIAMIDISARKGAHEALQMAVQITPSAKPFPGVGDEAFDFGQSDSNIPDAQQYEIRARKGDLLCTAELHRSNGAPGEALLVSADPQKIAVQLGALCTKIFAARAAP